MDLKQKVKTRKDNNNGLIVRIPTTVVKSMDLKVGQAANVEVFISRRQINIIFEGEKDDRKN